MGFWRNKACHFVVPTDFRLGAYPNSDIFDWGWTKMIRMIADLKGFGPLCMETKSCEHQLFQLLHSMVVLAVNRSALVILNWSMNFPWRSRFWSNVLAALVVQTRADHVTMSGWFSWSSWYKPCREPSRATAFAMTWHRFLRDSALDGFCGIHHLIIATCFGVHLDFLWKSWKMSEKITNILTKC